MGAGGKGVGSASEEHRRGREDKTGTGERQGSLRVRV